MNKKNSESKTQLFEYLQKNYFKGFSWKGIGKRFGLKDDETARKAWLGFREKEKNFGDLDKNDLESLTTQFTEDLRTGNAEISLQTSTEIRSLKDLEKLIETDKWDIVKYVQNYWGGKYQVKAILEPKRANESKAILNLLKNYKSTWKPVKKSEIITSKNLDENLLLINLNDLHFDKRDLDNNSIQDNIDNYFKVFDYLVDKAYNSSKITKSIFVVGNDVFNTDTIFDTTTNGTPQRCITTWDDAYEKVFDTMVRSIAYLDQFSEDGVHVVLVQGNHDRTKSYYLAHALEMYFKNDPRITFDRSININKCYVYGETFLGFNHGNNINDKLPLAFAQEFYKDWGKAKFHDIYIGDKHHNNQKVFKVQTQNDGNQGVKLRILPSLSKPDRWHDDNLFRSRQSGIAILYDKERGKCAEFEYQL